MKIKSSEEAVAKVLGAVVWADGVFDEAEKITCEEIAEAFEFDATKFENMVEKSFAEVENLDEEKLNDYLLNASVEIDEDDIDYVFEAALEIALTDGVLQIEEVENLMSIASALGVDDGRAIIMLCDKVKNEPEIEVKL